MWVVERTFGAVHSSASSLEQSSSFNAWSPDERYIYYTESSNRDEDTDLWVWDSTTGKSHPLTNTPDVHEYHLAVWPAYSEWLVFLSLPRALWQTERAYGYLTMIKIDGSGQQRLSEEQIINFDFSPDGKTMVYYTYDGAWLLQLGKAPEPFLPDQFAVKDWNIKGLRNPVWSPDGTKIAWWAKGENLTGEYSGVAVFDLEQKKAWFVHPFVHVGMGGWASFFMWDPTSQWIGLEVSDMQVERQGAWIAHYDSREEHHNGYTSYNTVWSPSGNTYLYKDTATAKIYQKQMGDWKTEETRLSYNFNLIDWIEIKSP